MNSSTKHIIVGTAGHIDHGKSSLVQALTGTNPDRLEEEKRRGITIDIGFAFLDMPGVRIGFVDVPGHEKFVSNMLAGAAGIDLVLLVIAADESSSRRHANILKSADCSASNKESSPLQKATWLMRTHLRSQSSMFRNMCAARFSEMRQLFQSVQNQAQASQS